MFGQVERGPVLAAVSPLSRKALVLAMSCHFKPPKRPLVRTVATRIGWEVWTSGSSVLWVDGPVAKVCEERKGHLPFCKNDASGLAFGILHLLWGGGRDSASLGLWAGRGTDSGIGWLWSLGPGRPFPSPGSQPPALSPCASCLLPPDRATMGSTAPGPIHLLELCDQKLLEFICNVDNKDLVWLEEIEEEAQRMFTR